VSTAPSAPAPEAGGRRYAWWKTAWVVAAVAYALPIAYIADGRLAEVTQKARERLILQHRLWELHPEFGGTPGTWTRVASRLLTDRQLMRRIRSKHGELAKDLELDYRRDLSVAQGEVVIVAATAWALPMLSLYGLVSLALRRRRPPQAAPAPPPAAPPADAHSRYRR
jgi:hypothetical protein